LLSPKTIADVRSQRNMVILAFGKKGADRTFVRFTHLGWAEGASWDEACDSFDHAKSEVLLPDFRHDLFLFLVLFSLVTLCAPQSQNNLKKPARRRRASRALDYAVKLALRIVFFSTTG
jgi:hypothetical protein